MRPATLVFVAMGFVGCGGSVSTPTAPTLPAVAAPPVVAQSFCAPPTTGRVYNVTVPGHATPAYVWLESVTPARDAAVRIGESYTLAYRHVTPPGYRMHVEWSVDGSERRAFASLLQGGCGSGTSQSQVPARAGSWQLRMRVWVEAGDGAASFVPTRPPVFEAVEPLDWTVRP